MQDVLGNTAVLAMQDLQKAMRGEAEKAGIKSEEDVVDIIKAIRAGEAGALNPKITTRAGFCDE